MATQTERVINALTNEVNLLKECVEWMRADAVTLREVTERLSIIEHRLAELTKSRELWGQRGWGVLTVLLTALSSLIGVVVGAVLNFYLNTRK